MGRANAGVGTGDRGTVASRHSFIPFLVRKTKSQVRRLKKRGKRKYTSFVKLGGCPERVPPRDWPTPKEGLERDPVQKEKEISVWGTQEDQENCLGNTEREQEALEPEMGEKSSRIFLKRHNCRDNF